MKCSIGDKIRFLNDVGGGTVVGFTNKTTVIVRDDDGFDIPVLMSEIVVISENNVKKIIENDMPIPVEEHKKSNIVCESKKISDDNGEHESNSNKLSNEEDEDGIEFETLLAFVPVFAANAATGDLQIYIINDSSYRMFYTVGKWKQHVIEPVGKGELEGDSKELIGMIKENEIPKTPVFQINFMLFKNREYTPQAVQQIDFELNPIKLLNKKIFTENDFFEQDAYIYTLASSRKMLKDYIANISDKDIEKSQKDKRNIHHKKNVQNREQAIEEVDLHIELLTDNKENLSNGEMLKLQIDRFTMSLDLGITSRTKRMVFIHGIGNGKLKHEIHRLLNTQYAGKVRYQDASFKEYGYGATMVFIK
jgi:hypothetical protein